MKPRQIAAPLESVITMDRADLAGQWRIAFGHSAPRGSQAALLRGAIAWQLQAAEEPGRSHAVQLQRRLRQWSAHSPANNLTVGTVLLREWKKQVHRVTVVEGGFEHEGTVFRSLSAISRRITGMIWSGPIFFGLIK